MKKWKFLKMVMVMVLISAFLVQISACGYIFYPERRNQPAGGNIDPTVAILDGLGLLLFIIPGVVAFIVDFSTHTIYFPPGEKSSLQGIEKEKMTAVPVPADQLNQQGIESIVSKHTGKRIDLDSAQVKVFVLDDFNQLAQKY